MKKVLNIENLSHSYHSSDGETPAIDKLSRKFDTQNPRKPYLAYFFAQI